MVGPPTGPLQGRADETRRRALSSRPRDRFVAPRDGYLSVLLHDDRRGLLEVLLDRGPMSREQLKDSVPYVSRSTFERTLHPLVAAGLIRGRRHAPDRRRRVYEATCAAAELLQIAREVAAVEARAPAGLRDPQAPPLMLVIADAAVRVIPRELVDGGLTYTELCSRLPELSDSTFAENLSLLTRSGIVQSRPGRRPERVYELTEMVPALARAILRAACLRLTMTPDDAPWLAGDLPSILKLLELAPALRAPRDARGAILLHVTHNDGKRGWPDAEVALEHGRVSQRRPGTTQPRVTARGRPVAWCHAILDGDLTGIEIDGDERLVHTLLSAITTAVNACPRA